jgi:hypothetical protein
MRRLRVKILVSFGGRGFVHEWQGEKMKIKPFMLQLSRQFLMYRSAIRYPVIEPQDVTLAHPVQLSDSRTVVSRSDIACMKVANVKL